MGLNIKQSLVILAAAALVACTSACGNGNQAKEGVGAPEAVAPSEPAPIVTANYEVKGFRDAEIRADGEAYTARRTQSHPQGISVLPREGGRPLKFDFAVAGNVERVSLYRAGTWTDLPTQQNYSVRFGPGGTFHVLVVPAVGQTATLTITGITDCTAVPQGGCPVMETP